MAGFVMLVLPSAYLAWTSRDMPMLGLFHDDGMYWVTAKSLATGNGYHILSLPGAPAATKYPLLYPLYLSFAWHVIPTFPQNLGWLALLAWLPLPPLIALTWKFLSNLKLGLGSRIVATAMLALSPTAVILSLAAMSHLLFCVLLLGVMLLLESFCWANSRSRNVFLVGIVGAMAYLTRSAALPLLITVPLVFGFQRRYRAAITFLAGMAPAVIAWMAWVARNRVVSPDVTTSYYTDYLGYYFRTMSIAGLGHVVVENIGQFFGSVGNLFLVGANGTLLGVPPGLVLTGICFAGIALLVRRGQAVHYAVFALLYIGMILIWNSPPTDALVLPIFPLLLAGFFKAIETPVQRVVMLWRSGTTPGRLVATLGMTTAVTLAALWAFQTGGVLTRDYPDLIQRRRVIAHSQREAFRWIADNTPQSATFLALNDAVLYLYTGRRACWLFTDPMDWYHGGLTAIANEFDQADVFSRRWRLTHAFLTDEDFPQPLQRQVIEAMDRVSWLKTVKTFAGSSVRRFESD